MSATPNHRWDRRSSGFFRAVIGEPPDGEEITRRNDFPIIIPARFRRLLWRRKSRSVRSGTNGQPACPSITLAAPAKSGVFGAAKHLSPEVAMPTGYFTPPQPAFERWFRLGYLVFVGMALSAGPALG